jgi:hypothetical protein
MLLQRHVSPAHRVSAIEKQLSHLRQDLANIGECKAECGADPAGSFVMGYGEAVLTAAVTYLEQKLAETLSTHAKQAAE